ncbi:Concanavalin A-like lectin/glucanase, subgroup [Artemisia annua]|uniref:Concanavalin A-like lectin/glucanase, subgroup n=1 Tax=Artemisia annua TaxID=35608 RepID=A0A2U1KG89_ARTAN|nr:Concanavalin A-like lectin/glucanase, subgroup [Artemisia annua]
MFKSSIQNTKVLPNWIPSNNVCNFSYVFCKNNKVASIDMSNNDLSVEYRTVADNLLTIETLESLNARNYNISGTIGSFRSGECSSTIGSFRSGECSSSVEFLDLSVVLMWEMAV